MVSLFDDNGRKFLVLISDSMFIRLITHVYQTQTLCISKLNKSNSNLGQTSVERRDFSRRLSLTSERMKETKRLLSNSSTGSMTMRTNSSFLLLDSQGGRPAPPSKKLFTAEHTELETLFVGTGSKFLIVFCEKCLLKWIINKRLICP